MTALLVLAVAITGTSALAAVPADDDMISSAQPRRTCVLFPQPRSGARRICLTEAEWRERLGPDWVQILTGRNSEDDLDALRVRIRENPRLPNR